MRTLYVAVKHTTELILIGALWICCLVDGLFFSPESGETLKRITHDDADDDDDVDDDEKENMLYSIIPQKHASKRHPLVNNISRFHESQMNQK